MVDRVDDWMKDDWVTCSDVVAYLPEGRERFLAYLVLRTAAWLDANEEPRLSMVKGEPQLATGIVDAVENMMNECRDAKAAPLN